MGPTHFLTISSLAMQDALISSGVQIELLHEMDVINEFETIVRGGLTSVVQGKVTSNKIYFSTYNPQKPFGTVIFLDVNTLYASVLDGKPTVGDFFELSEQEVAIFDTKEIVLFGDHCYALVTDFEITDKFKLKADDFQ